MSFEWIPKKFKNRPWVTIAVFVAAIVVLTLLGVYVLIQVASVLGPDWVRERLNEVFGSGDPLAGSGNP